MTLVTIFQVGTVLLIRVYFILGAIHTSNPL